MPREERTQVLLPTIARTADGKVPRWFWELDVLQAAQLALGMVLARRLDGTVIRGRIVEIEAYGGAHDPASHAHHGRTPRNAVMFGPPGMAYIYFIYGMHHCLNIVTGPEGVASALLVRALEPLANAHGRLDGPARVCAALKLDRSLNGEPLDGDVLWLEPGSSPLPPTQVLTSPRIGIAYAGEAARWPWRFSIRGNHYVSRPAR
jgi:DNA-3-methyladenine glycosylase